MRERAPPKNGVGLDPARGTELCDGNHTDLVNDFRSSTSPTPVRFPILQAPSKDCLSMLFSSLFEADPVVATIKCRHNCNDKMSPPLWI